MRQAILSVGLLMCCLPARAEIVGVNSLETLADTCPYVATYTVTSVSATYVGLVTVEVALAETLRGKPPEKLSFEYPTYETLTDKGQPIPKAGDSFLIFLRDAGRDDVRWEQIISLTRPSQRGPAHVAIRSDLKLLADGVEVLKAVKDRMAKQPVTPVGWRERSNKQVRLELEYNTPAWNAVWGGSSCYLIVPEDLQPHAPEKAKP